MFIALTSSMSSRAWPSSAIVLLQAGKGADIGSAFGGAGSQAVFGSMGTPTMLGKITTGVAIVFTITSFTLAILGGEQATSVIREAAPRRRPRPRRPRRLRPRAGGTPRPAPAPPAPPRPESDTLSA